MIGLPSSPGLLEQFDADFAIDFSAEVPAPVPVPGGPCDYDFEAQREVEQSAWEDRQCWLDQIAVEVAVRGYTAELGEAPNSIGDIPDDDIIDPTQQVIGVSV